MAERTIAPYGSWTSPITTDLIVADSVDLGDVALDGNDTYWLEGRPNEGGRVVLVRRQADGNLSDVTPAPFNVRTRVHEYGGGAYLVAAGTVYFSNFADNRLYTCRPGGEPRAITPEAPWRYADFVADLDHGRLIGVREDHSPAGHEAVNTLVAIDLGGTGGQRDLVAGNDFYAAPRLSPDGARLAWLTWNHPNMPWDGTELWVGEIAPDGSIGARHHVAGGADESIFQPEWSPDGSLYFVSDRTGWWNLYRSDGAEVEPLTTLEAELGRPQWGFRMSTYGFAGPGRIICAINANGTGRLADLDVGSKALQPIATPYTHIGSLRVCADRAVFVAASPTELSAVVQLDLTSNATHVLRRSGTFAVDEGYISIPQAIEFPTERGLTAHAWHYPPVNRDFAGPSGEKPPLIVRSHGGPTGAAGSELDPSIQFWTSRGFAYVDVNYGGSAGYGRAYRQRLNGMWGVVDVEDCANAARYLVGQGLADPSRLLIHGRSAGGYTTLCALTFRDDFTAGASCFGISDMESFVGDTHKFESRYVDRLIGPFPESRARYRERSPLAHSHRLSRPMILFQGLDDKVVPPNQAELMVEALRAKGIPFAYVAFEAEGHGFRRAENIKRSLEAELYFYSRIFGFDLPEPVEPVPIENLDNVAS